MNRVSLLHKAEATYHWYVIWDVSIPYESGLTFTQKETRKLSELIECFNPLWIGSHFYTTKKLGELIEYTKRFNPLWIGSHFYTFAPFELEGVYVMTFQSPMNRVSLLHNIGYTSSISDLKTFQSPMNRVSLLHHHKIHRRRSVVGLFQSPMNRVSLLH